MRITTSRKQVHRMARRALLTFREETAVQSLPVKFRAVNPLFKLAHLSKFDKPLLAQPN